MIMAEIWVYGDLRSRRRWTDSLKVLAKGLELAREAGVGVAMVLLGSGFESPMGEDDMHNPDPAASVDPAKAARQAAALGVRSVYCLEHSGLSVPRTDVYADVMAPFFHGSRPLLVP